MTSSNTCHWRSMALYERIRDLKDRARARDGGDSKDNPLKHSLMKEPN